MKLILTFVVTFWGMPNDELAKEGWRKIKIKYTTPGYYSQ